MSIFSRIRRLFWDDATPAPSGPPGLGVSPPATGPARPAGAPDPSHAAPAAGAVETGAAASDSADERELSARVAALVPGAVTEEETRRILELAARLGTTERARSSVELLRRACRLLPALAELRLLLAEQLHGLRELAAAEELLAELVDHPRHGARAHFLLGEARDAQGDAAAALQHYEAVLAHDFCFPRARGRADALRRQLDRPVAVVAPTVFGAEDLGGSQRYLLQRELGRGGGGTVYLARDRALGRPLAVKVLHPHVARRQEARLQLFCEARIAAALRHPRTVAIYDLDETLNLVAMEYCSGGALADEIARAPLSLPVALRRLAEITGVLDAVHRCGVIHRDLKPANLLLRRAGSDAPLVLSDFGAAHAGAETASEGAAAGSLVYMAPEQRRALRVDPRADLYACGVVLLEMLLGRLPLSPQQALAGADLVELADLWAELADRLPAAVRSGLLELGRALVHPAADRRPETAGAVAARARALAGLGRRAALREETLRAVERGVGERSPAVEAWLRALPSALGAATGSGVRSGPT